MLYIDRRNMLIKRELEMSSIKNCSYKTIYLKLEIFVYDEYILVTERTLLIFSFTNFQEDTINFTRISICHLV